MRMSVLGCALVLASGCIDTDATTSESKSYLSELSAAQRARLASAVVDDASVAAWYARTIARLPGPCTDVVQSSFATTLTAKPGCTADGSAFSGAITITSAGSRVPSYRFDNVRITGDAPTDLITIDGAIDQTETWQGVMVSTNLTMTRAGLSAHTELSWSARDWRLAPGSYVEGFGLAADVWGQARGGAFTLTASDTDTFSPDTPGCLRDSFGERTCVHTDQPSQFLRIPSGIARLICTQSSCEGDLVVRQRVDSLEPASRELRIGAHVAQTSSKLTRFEGSWMTAFYEFRSSGVDVARDAIDYSVTTAGGARAELMTVPRATWSYAAQPWNRPDAARE